MTVLQELYWFMAPLSLAHAHAGIRDCVSVSLVVFQVVNKPDSHGGSLDWTKICERSSKVITFIDLAGHEKYLKTTVFGMTGHMPDFCMLMVSPGLVLCALHFHPVRTTRLRRL